MHKFVWSFLHYLKAKTGEEDLPVRWRTVTIPGRNIRERRPVNMHTNLGGNHIF